MKYSKLLNTYYNEGNSITILYNNKLFSGVPSLELLLEWGFEDLPEPEETLESLLYYDL